MIYFSQILVYVLKKDNIIKCYLINNINKKVKYTFFKFKYKSTIITINCDLLL